MKFLSNITILVVDDEPLQSMMTCLILEKYGYTPISSHSGEDAILKIQGNKDIVLVLMDIELGQGMNGVEAAKFILENRDLPVVFHSGHSDITTLQKIQDVHRYGFILKSSGEHILISNLEMALELYFTKKKLKENELKFNLITKNINEIFWIEDTINQTILYITPSVENLFGFSPEELYDNKLKFLEAVYREDLKIVQENYEVTLNTKAETNFQYRIINKQGEIKWLQARLYPIKDENSNVYNLVGFAENISQMKSISLALKEKSQIQELQFNQMPIICTFIDLDFKILKWNLMCEKVFGFKEADVIGKDVISLVVAPEDLNNVKNIPNLIDSETDTLEYTNYVINKNGERILCNWYNSPIRDNDGKILGLICSAIDITKVKESEETNLKLLNEKEVLLKEIHHRVKNNMATISSLLYLEEEEITEENAKTSLQEARKRIMSMMIIYEKLFESKNFNDISLKEYLNSLLVELTTSFPMKNAEFFVDLEDVVCATNTLYPVGIILNELLTNCYKHAFPLTLTQGRINIKGERLEPKLYQISVEDNGIGYDSEEDGKSKVSTFGLKLIDILTKQIKGKLIKSLGNGNKGTKTLIQFQVT